MQHTCMFRLAASPVRPTYSLVVVAVFAALSGRAITTQHTLFALLILLYRGLDPRADKQHVNFFMWLKQNKRLSVRFSAPTAPAD